MKIFKLKVGSSKIYELNKNIFELQTKQKSLTTLLIIPTSKFNMRFALLAIIQFR